MNTEWDFRNSEAYIAFESGQGNITDEIPYQLIGRLAFASIFEKFKHERVIYACDIGCYLGASTYRWFKYSQQFNLESSPKIKIMGTDIFAENVNQAQQIFAEVPGLHFESMQKNEDIPKFYDSPYHLIFAAFVFDTISSPDELQALCHNISNALRLVR